MGERTTADYFSKKSWLIMFITVCFCFISAPVAVADYSVGFAADEIRIIDPPLSGTEVNGLLPVSGAASVEAVWFCLRSPENEVETQYAPVIDGKFTIDLAFRFGPGKYTVWADDNPNQFDGKIRFYAYNVGEDNRYSSASTYVDSGNAKIVELSHILVNEAMSDQNKVKAIHDWVAGNIEYDYQAYLDGIYNMKTASATLSDKKGLCGGYAYLFAALCRAADLPAKVIYGQAKSSKGWAIQDHAWNEVLVDDEWMIIDTTWDSGYIRDNQFIPSLTYDYFDPNPQDFALTHTGKEDKLY